MTVQHIFKLVVLGCYQSNHFFRVDKGFVAQTADVVGGRSIPMNSEQRVSCSITTGMMRWDKQNPSKSAAVAGQAEGEKTVPLEVKADVKHLKGAPPSC